MARIAVGGFHHATNSFSPTVASYDEFERGYAWPPLTRGEGVFAAVRGNKLALAGFIDDARARGHELVPTVWAAASPSGPVTKDAYERIALMLLDDVADAMPVDAVYLSLHGAMLAEHAADGEGELLRRLRDIVGRDRPIVATLAYHANVSPEMVRHATMLIAGRTCPRVDAEATGRRAAFHLDALLSGLRIFGGYRPLPFLIPLPWSGTQPDPAASAFELLKTIEADAVNSVSFTAGFPVADVPDRGPAILAYGRDSAAVEQAIDRIAEHLSRQAHLWTGTVLDPDSAVVEAMRRATSARGPVILADVQDDPGAGGTGDTTGLLAALARHGATATVGLVYDPHVATIAHRCGEGAEIAVCLGGKHGTGSGSFDASFVVESLADGRFDGTGPVYGGAHMELAPTACLRTGSIRVLVVGKRVQAADRAMFRHLGIDPAREPILALKSSVQFRADFEAIADSILIVAAPGSAAVDPATLPFATRRTKRPA